MYADDTTLVGNLSNFDNKNGNDSNINIELVLLNDWLKLNKLSLNEKKTYDVLQSAKRSPQYKTHYEQY